MMKKYISLISIIIIFIFSFSCEEIISEIGCDDCYTPKPDSADIEVKLSFSELNDSIPLTFYRGKIDENVIEWIDTATIGNSPDGIFYLFSQVNKYYSIKAVYKTKNGKTITAVDGDKLVRHYNADGCDTECWTIRGRVLDVRLKYD